MFQCKQCSCCCRNVGKVSWAKDMALPNGICKYLNQTTNLCTIYSRRPIFCNVEAFYEKFYSNKMTKKEFFDLNERECEKIQELTKHGKRG